jgi:Zn-dependent peptidase ImmA (M78 family)
VRAALTDAIGRDRPDKVIAAEVGMTPDAFSRAIKGERAFSSLELARLADLAQADVHYLITGEPDPFRVVFAARHDYDPATGTRDVPGEADDAETLNAVTLAYTQAQIWLNRERRADHAEGTTTAGHVDLPSEAAAIRGLLGVGFVRDLADRIEEVFGIDVLRIQNLSTDYSFTLDGRRVILLKAQGNWFRSNYSLAHELAHLALGHHDVRGSASSAEMAANQFASDLLLPGEELRAINWQTIDEGQVARKIWEWGVSTKAIAIRLETLRLSASPEVSAALQQPTQRLLRMHPEATSEPRPIMVSTVGTLFATVLDPISTRMRDAAERRIPASLIKAHLDGIAAGQIAKGTLAWLLETPAQELGVDEPAPPQQVSVEDLAADLGLVGSQG